MIEVFDKTRRRVAILENAYAASESQKINSVWYFYFSLPYGDSKNEYCKPFYYVRPDGGELYRIMPETLSVSESGGISYQCEHVLATLIDNVLFGYHVVGNLGVYTADVIRYILDHQLVKNWVLDECDFRNQFEYGWEQESLLSALFSVLSPLSSPMIVTDTTVYPWRLSLKKLVTTGRPEMYVRRRYNMTSYTRGRDPQNTRGRLPRHFGGRYDLDLFRRLDRFLRDRARGGGVDNGPYRNLCRRRARGRVYARMEKRRTDYRRRKYRK